MTHQLITLLGGSGETDKEKRYRKTRYRFPDNITEPCEYFGFALLQQLKPDSVLILGTSGSMWDVLLEAFDLTDRHQALYEDLYSAVCNKNVQQKNLDTLQQAMQTAIDARVTLKLIPHGLHTGEQHQILDTMATGISAGDSVSIDITHGLRHLPMLAQMSALYIAKVKQAKVSGVYYGAFDLTVDGITPVADLSGLLDMADWITAVSGFGADGNYGIFSPLVEQSHPRLATLLSDAAFNERNLRHDDSQKLLRRIPPVLDDTPLTGVGALFEKDIRKRIDWHIGKGNYAQQRQLAINYLNSRDYLRAVLYAFETFITGLVEKQGGNCTRQAAKEFFEADHNPKTNPDWLSYEMLRSLRNVIAHGDQKSHRKLEISTEAGLQKTLKRLIGKLLPEKI